MGIDATTKGILSSEVQFSYRPHFRCPRLGAITVTCNAFSFIAFRLSSVSAEGEDWGEGDDFTINFQSNGISDFLSEMTCNMYNILCLFLFETWMVMVGMDF